jgi:hypothetical protein
MKIIKGDLLNLALEGKSAVIVSLIVVIFLFGCSNDNPQDKTIHYLKSDNMSSESNVRLVIHWPGDDFASKQDLETRDKIEGLIVERKVGKIIRVGTGMGWMDISIAVKDKRVAQTVIKEIIKTVAPTVKFSIE